MIKLSHFYHQYKLEIFHVLAVFMLISFNLFISNLVRTSNLFFIPNDNPFGFQGGVLVSSAIVIFLSWSLVYFKISSRFPLVTVLILSGAFSNYLEKWLLFDNVADYISVPLSHFNIADMQIWVGLILLNWMVWFGGGEQTETISENHPIRA